MLEQFWLDLILNNKGRRCYFHNWAGYDSILSMAALLNVTGYTFKPIVHNGEIMSINGGVPFRSGTQGAQVQAGT